MTGLETCPKCYGTGSTYGWSDDHTVHFAFVCSLCGGEAQVSAEQFAKEADAAGISVETLREAVDAYWLEEGEGEMA